VSTAVITAVTQVKEDMFRERVQSVGGGDVLDE
jgi:hypothetical protein